MSTRHAPCFVIPVYNHGGTVGQTVAAVSRHGHPIFLVDDGSGPDTARVLDALAAANPLIRLLRRPGNGGKGAAVMDGFRAAIAEGMTHALQVDADGQHALDDIPRFLDAGRESPGKIICGVPIYDASIPKGRLYGRYATHVWVWIETLSLDIQDSMCGFRMYPLAPVRQLMERVSIGTRMDFDIEILVRLYWRGLRVINLPTVVTYPEDGISHFRMLRDNLRITWLHTRLAAGMVFRLPMLLAHRLTGEPR